MKDTMFENAAIELRGIRKTFKLSEDKNAKIVLALDGIDLSFRKGDFVTIIGPSKPTTHCPLSRF